MLADEFAQTISERRSVGPKQQTHNAPSDDVFVRAARAARSGAFPQTPSFRAVL